MKTRTIATLTALSLTALTGLSAHAEGSAVAVAEPVDGIEVIVVRAKRPETLITDAATVAEAAPITAAPASGTSDEIEVILVTATRADQLAAIRELAREAIVARADRINAARMSLSRSSGVPRSAYRSWAGMPIR
jgi:hypothetical protein